MNNTIEIPVKTGFGKYPVQDAIRKAKVEQEVKEEEQIKSFPLPYPQVLLWFVIGAIVTSGCMTMHYNSKYGPVIEALPQYNEARQQAEENTERIKWLVKKNEQLTEIQNQATDKIILWANGMRPKTQKVTNE